MAYFRASASTLLIKKIYNAIVELGVTPESKAVPILIDTIKTKLVSRQKAIDAINSTKAVANGTKFEQAGMVSVQVSCSVNNHDNSGEDYIGCRINKSGTVVTSDRTWIKGWSGGSTGCSAAFTVEPGDTVSYSFWGSDDKAIFVNGSGSIVYTPNPF